MVQAQLELGYAILDFGRAPGERQAADQALAAGLHLSRTLQNVALSVSIAYFNVQEAEGNLAAAQQILSTADALFQNAQAQFDNGRATLPDVENARAGVAQSRYELAAAKQREATSKLTLSEVVGVEPTVHFKIGQPESPLASEHFVSAVEPLIDAARRARPDLLAAERELAAAREGVKVEHASYLPSISLSGQGGQTAVWPTSDFGTLGQANVTTWGAELSLHWQVFDSARQYRVAESRASVTRTQETLRKTRDEITREVWEAYVAYQTAVERRAAAAQYLKAANTSYESSEEAFRYGVRSLVDVVQSERQLAEARYDDVHAQAELLRSVVTLGNAVSDLPSRTQGAP